VAEVLGTFGFFNPILHQVASNSLSSPTVPAQAFELGQGKQAVGVGLSQDTPTLSAQAPSRRG
jgi:hypothetical protein